MSYRKQAVSLFRLRQDEICAGLKRFEPEVDFIEDNWLRPEESQLGSGGGGRTRVLKKGNVFESAGVNFSEVYGMLPESMVKTLVGKNQELEFFATGISLVIHPFSPLVPTVHANFRYLEVGDKAWFGGGADLTPYYLIEEDARHFHSTWLELCGQEFYHKAKKACDEYFYLPHRKEARGIGGIFYDYLGREEPDLLKDYFQLSQKLSTGFLPSYLPIVEKRKDLSWSEREKNFQLLRRGRYVEFNLLQDRGTQFGVKTGGRTESILMSLPPEVRWEYCFEPEPGSKEAHLLEVLCTPQAWA